MQCLDRRADALAVSVQRFNIATDLLPAVGILPVDAPVAIY